LLSNRVTPSGPSRSRSPTINLLREARRILVVARQDAEHALEVE
jgi:hypothetical protein